MIFKPGVFLYDRDYGFINIMLSSLSAQATATRSPLFSPHNYELGLPQTQRQTS